MSEPERWFTSADAPSGMSDMLGAARSVGPSTVERAALAGKLGVATSGLWIAPVLKGLAASVIVAGGVWGASLSGGNEGAPASRQEVVPSSAEQSMVFDEAKVGEDTPPIEVEVMAKEQPAEEASAATPLPERRVVPKVESAEPAKPSEISLISQAKGAIESSPRKALSLLAEHAKAYPSGVLAEEREVLRIRALKNLGKEDAAHAQEEKFRKEHPESVHHVP